MEVKIITKKELNQTIREIRPKKHGRFSKKAVKIGASLIILSLVTLAIATLILDIEPFSMQVERNNIDVQGGQQTVFYIDGVMTDTSQPITIVLDDLPLTMVSGQTYQQTVNFASHQDNGNYEILVDLSAMDDFSPFTDENDPRFTHDLYGITVAVKNGDGSPLSIPYPVLGMMGETGNDMLFEVTIHSDFVDTTTPLNIEITLDVDEYQNQAPQSFDNYYGKNSPGYTGLSMPMPVLDNDIDDFNSITITSIDQGSIQGTLTIINEGQSIQYTKTGSQDEGSGQHMGSYTITDNYGLTSTANIYLEDLS